jgi:hypothetical protein
VVWGRIDDGFPEHGKSAFVGPLGQALHVAAICYGNRHLTDGFVPEDHARTLLPLTDRQWRELMPRMLAIAPRQRNPFWHQVDGGYQVHDFLEYNPSKAQVEEERARKNAIRDARAQAGRVGGTRSAEHRRRAREELNGVVSAEELERRRQALEAAEGPVSDVERGEAWQRQQASKRRSKGAV